MFVFLTFGAEKETFWWDVTSLAKHSAGCLLWQEAKNRIKENNEWVSFSDLRQSLLAQTHMHSACSVCESVCVRLFSYVCVLRLRCVTVWDWNVMSFFYIWVLWKKSDAVFKAFMSFSDSLWLTLTELNQSPCWKWRIIQIWILEHLFLKKINE